MKGSQWKQVTSHENTANTFCVNDMLGLIERKVPTAGSSGSRDIIENLNQ